MRWRAVMGRYSLCGSLNVVEESAKRLARVLVAVVVVVWGPKCCALAKEVAVAALPWVVARDAPERHPAKLTERTVRREDWRRRGAAMRLACGTLRACVTTTTALKKEACVLGRLLGFPPLERSVRSFVLLFTLNNGGSRIHWPFLFRTRRRVRAKMTTPRC
jgi:hypothetical protein